MITRTFEGYFCLVIIAVILHPSLQAPIPMELKEREINGKIISCIPTNCSLNEIFKPCQWTGQRDTCIPCPKGTVILDPLDTSQWDYAPDCVNPGCDDCQTGTNTTLTNKDSCGKTEMAKCECDRTKLFYGNDPHKCIRFNGDCNLEGFQLTQTGVCERCPNGTEKQLNDSSLCVPKIQQLLNDTKNVTTDDPGQGEGGSRIEWWAALVISIAVAVVIVILTVFIIVKVNPCNIRETFQRKNASIRRGRFTLEDAQRYSELLGLRICGERDWAAIPCNFEEDGSTEVEFEDAAITHSDEEADVQWMSVQESSQMADDDQELPCREDFLSMIFGASPFLPNEPPEVDPEQNDELDVMNEDNSIAYSCTEDSDGSCITSNSDGIQHQTNVKSVVSDETNVKSIVTDETNKKSVVTDETNVKSVVSDETNVKSVVSDETNVKSVVSDETNVKSVVSGETSVKSVVSGVVRVNTNVNHPGDSLNNHAEEGLGIESLIRGASSSSQQNVSDLICEQYVQSSVQFQSAPSSNAVLDQSLANNGGIHFSQSVHPSSGYSSN